MANGINHEVAQYTQPKDGNPHAKSLQNPWHVSTKVWMDKADVDG